ncbi:MAG: protein translocase subunit SecF [Deltaproteobacteria bacterium]|nr:protein translocase subunit SecF [Deltaproteobacteria bacterium]MBI3388413.1 protein translocase subunit SecF [Deltaproteobacteria bacterium]
MELIKPGTNFDFVGIRYYAVIVSTILNLAVVLFLIARGGPNYGVDFSGGTVMQVKFKTPPSVSDVRGALASAEFGDVTIQDFGAAGEFLIRLPMTGEETAKAAVQITDSLSSKFGQGQVEVLRVESVGPRVGSDLRRKAILAVCFSTMMMASYIWLRFQWRFGVGAAVALVHDVLITLGALVVMHYEIDLTIVAALLTVVGYSVHDTVIVSDRIRENMRKSRRESMAQIINSSINETLSRTILTSGTALLVTLALYFLGGSVINGFAFALVIGFITGTYSSIFIASPIVLAFERAPAGRGKR